MTLKRNKFKEIKELRKANISMNESVETSLKAFDRSLKNLQLEYKKFRDNSVKPRIQALYDLGILDKIEKKR